MGFLGEGLENCLEGEGEFSVLHKVLLELIKLILGGQVADEEEMRNFLEGAVRG